MIPGNIPQELRDRPQWICWKEATRNGKATKIPMRPDGSNQPAKSSDIATWGTFDQAVETAAGSDWGIGYVFNNAGPYVGIDLDGCLDGPSTPADWLPGLDPFADETYIERSPSGEGLHLIIKESRIPDWWTNQKEGEGDDEQGVEVYDDGRYFTFTGDTLDLSTQRVSAEIDLEEWLKDAWAVFNDDEPWDRGSGGSFTTGKERRDASSRSSSDEIDIGIYDVISRGSYPRGERCGHPFHSSQTDSNFMVDEDDDTFRCWRHSVTGNALHLLGLETGVIDCGDWAGNGLDSETWGKIFEKARGRGYDIPEAKPQKPQRDPVQADGGAAAANPTGTKATDIGYDSLRDRVKDEIHVPLNPDQYEVDIPKITHDTAVDRFATIMVDEYDFVRPREDTRGWRDTLYVYSEEDGIYEPFGESHLEYEAERLLGDFATNQRVNEVIGKIERRARVSERRLDTEPNRLVVGNGILDLTTGELDDLTPEEYHTQSIPVDYVPGADCPAINEFFHDIVEPEDVPKLYRLIAHALYKEYAAEKAAMLLGEGQNGKSVFLTLLEEFLGQYNVSNQSLQKLNEDDWSANNLVGKLANIHPDMSDQTVETMQMFKKLTGRDSIDADVKFEKPVKFENYATLIFACNRMPVLKDDTRGNWRRWMLIKFPNTFERSDEDFKEKRELMDELTADGELQGLLARCVDEIREWSNGRRWFPGAPHWRDARRQIRRAAEPIYDFAHACLVESKDEDAWIRKEEVRKCYRLYASDEGLPPISREHFGRKLLNETDLAIESAQKRDGGPRFRVYEGVRFSERAQKLLADEEEEEEDRRTNPQRTIDSSTSGPAERVVRITSEETAGGGTIAKGELLSMVTESGLTLDEAKKGLEQARSRGDVTEEPEGEFYT